MRTFPLLAMGAWILAGADAARAVAPCPETCHLRQGQPLLLADADALLITRCDRVYDSAGKPSPATCATERLDLDGKLQARLPRVPHDSDEEFTHEQLTGHTVVGLSWQVAWSNRAQPYVLNELSTHQRLTLSLAKSVLTCEAPGQPTVSRDFGCIPSDVRVFAITWPNKTPRRPVVVIGVCRPTPHSEHEVVVACSASESKR
jgi:hypothetical protein